MRLQAEIDRQAAIGKLPQPALVDFIHWLHLEFYKDASKDMLTITGDGREFVIEPGKWRSRPEHDNAVGRHIPPSSERVADFMAYFENRYRFEKLVRRAASWRSALPIIASTTFIPFRWKRPCEPPDEPCDGALRGIGAHGLWSISRGLSRGLSRRPRRPRQVQEVMNAADAPRQGDLDGRGNPH